MVDASMVEELAGMGLSVDEIAVVVKCSARTLQRRFVTPLKEGRTRLNASLKRRQYSTAMDGNITMLIWLGKQYLGQTDKTDLAATHQVQADARLSIPDVDPRNDEGPTNAG
jgi:hypothetical protein